MSVGRWKRDCYEIRLASARLLPTTSIWLANINASSSSGSIAAVAEVRVLRRLPKVAPGNCDKWKYGDAAHSCVVGQELVRICNHKFV
jgi:hypothetical protein